MRVEQAYAGLAAAVVAQALKDRKLAEKRLAMNNGDKIALGMIAEVDDFLSSSWGRMLLSFCNVDDVKEMH